MKETWGIIRIDNLGRVVIPKEIRRAMRTRDGDIFATLLIHRKLMLKITKERKRSFV